MKFNLERILCNINCGLNYSEIFSRHWHWKFSIFYRKFLQCMQQKNSFETMTHFFLPRRLQQLLFHVASNENKRENCIYIFSCTTFQFSHVWKFFYRNRSRCKKRRTKKICKWQTEKYRVSSIQYTIAEREGSRIDW